ncbi:MAG: transketolase family protein [Clostridiales bacterium]|nr:transketolase family protein [Clostridiales bacterium]
MECRNQRIAYGNTLVEAGKTNQRLVVLDADLSGSTMGKMFEQAFPDRHYEMGIAEANMTSVAAGLSLTGWIPFTNSFAVFSAGRAYDQIRQTIAIGNLNVKIVGSSSGLSDYGDGATHQAIEDIAYMQAIPNMTVICPADANETASAVKTLINSKGPCYLRLNRNDYDNVTEQGKTFVIGKPSVLREGSDVTVFACGYMVSLALKAASELEGEISVRVVNVSTIKPLDREAIIGLTQGCRGVVTAEEHTVIGGLGSAVARALAKTCKPIEFVGVNDTFGCSGHCYQDVLDYHGLTKEHIMESVRKIGKM